MIRIIILTVFCAVFGSSSTFAQKQKPIPTVNQTEVQHPREIRTEEKKEELSKRLLKRKNELREEEHEHDKARKNAEAHEKTNNPK